MSIELDLSKFENKRVLCAVSGGADSMCLLHLLFSKGVAVAAAHYEHGIRGEEAIRDADFVAAWCGERGIECVVAHGDVPKYADENGLSIEEAARKLRYEFLADAAQKLNCDYIATAHNADDNAETVIFNLARGTGLQGLRGIPAERGNIIRPILGVSRAEIEKYLEENGIPHVEDSTNTHDDYSRNLIRHRVIPALRKINPALSASVSRTARLAAQDDECLTEMARQFISDYYDGESLPLDKLNALHRAVSSRVIRLLAYKSLSMEHVEAVLKLAGETELCYADIPGGRLRAERGRLWFGEEAAGELEERILVPGETLLIPEAGLKVRSEFAVYGTDVNGLFKNYQLKYENIVGTMKITPRRPGDRYRPHGRGCSKSLKSLFAEKKYTQSQRETTPVIRDEKGILALYGFAADERCTPQPGEKVLKIIFENI